MNQKPSDGQISEHTLSQELLHNIYEEVKTPYKYGLVLKPEEGKAYDCPSVFRFKNKWYMVYITFDGLCYETALAESDDLLNWKELGKILKSGGSGWDSMQNAGFISLQDINWGGSNELQQFENKYWISYIGGNNKGYETPPLSIGIANTEKPDQAVEWNRLIENPVLTSEQKDAREFENEVLFKSNIIKDIDNKFGHRFVMFYNAKSRESIWTEKIGIAVSDDMRKWERYGNFVISNNKTGISGDPQVVKINDVWVMFYFGAHWKPHAFDTFACSYDLINWTHWNGVELLSPTEFYDQEYAHKPWMIKHDGIVYHFYCAVGSKGRTIALATSEYIGESRLNI